MRKKKLSKINSSSSNKDREIETLQFVALMLLRSAAVRPTVRREQEHMAGCLAGYLRGQVEGKDSVSVGQLLLLSLLVVVVSLRVDGLARVIARVIGCLIVNLGPHNTSRKESSVQSLHRLLYRSLRRELDKYFHQDFSVLALALTLLIDDDSVHLAVLFTFVLRR